MRGIVGLDSEITLTTLTLEERSISSYIPEKESRCS